MSKVVDYGKLGNFLISDLDYSEDDEVKVTVELNDFRDIIISYKTIVALYEGLMENHPGYPDKLYGEEINDAV
jgi:hypothetical protein